MHVCIISLTGGDFNGMPLLLQLPGSMSLPLFYAAPRSFLKTVFLQQIKHLYGSAEMLIFQPVQPVVQT